LIIVRTKLNLEDYKLFKNLCESNGLTIYECVRRAILTYMQIEYSKHPIIRSIVKSSSEKNSGNQDPMVINQFLYDLDRRINNIESKLSFLVHTLNRIKKDNR
jgi:hypothetical protein